ALLGVKGRARLDEVREIVDKKIGAHLSLDPVAAAAAIVRVANDRMAGAIRLVSLQRGRDPRDFVLFAFGGAGPLHAVALARELAIPKVLVPARPGITSALGCLVADVRHDFVRTINQGLLRMDVSEARAILAAQVGLRGTPTPGGPVATRKVWFDSQSNNWHDTPIYRREGLPAGTVLTGPAIVEQLDATTVIEPGDHARVDAFGNLEITVRAT